MEIVRDFSSFLCSSFGVVDDANDRSIDRALGRLIPGGGVAAGDGGRNLGRDNVNDLYCLLIQDELQQNLSSSRPGLVSVCDRFFFSSSSYPRLSPSNGTCASRGGDSSIGGFVYVVDDATTRESETKQMVD